jgi:predicted AlkP superfamily phosphohydrolase/phosphomutase
VDFLKEDLMDVLEGRRRVLEAVWQEEQWDLLVMHIMETDRINHFLWHVLEMPESEDGRFFLDFYRKVDSILGEAAARLDEQTTLMILSDHGFCRKRNDVQLNRWLKNNGYLELLGGPAEGFNAISAKSRACALVPGRMHLLRKDLWRRGAVEPADYEKVRSALIEALGSLQAPDDGGPVLERIFRREEIFHGPYAHMAPDVLAHPRDGYDLKAALGDGEVFSDGPITGMHTYGDAFVFVSGHQFSAAAPSITDVMPTILELLGVEPPQDLDGRPFV